MEALYVFLEEAEGNPARHDCDRFAHADRPVLPSLLLADQRQAHGVCPGIRARQDAIDPVDDRPLDSRPVLCVHGRTV